MEDTDPQIDMTHLSTWAVWAHFCLGGSFPDQHVVCVTFRDTHSPDPSALEFIHAGEVRWQKCLWNTCHTGIYLKSSFRKHLPHMQILNFIFHTIVHLWLYILITKGREMINLNLYFLCLTLICWRQVYLLSSVFLTRTHGGQRATQDETRSDTERKHLSTCQQHSAAIFITAARHLSASAWTMIVALVVHWEHAK